MLARRLVARRLVVQGGGVWLGISVNELVRGMSEGWERAHGLGQAMTLMHKCGTVAGLAPDGCGGL